MAKNKNYTIVDSVEKLDKAIKNVRKAQEIFATYSQEQVDKILQLHQQQIRRELDWQNGS